MSTDNTVTAAAYARPDMANAYSRLDMAVLRIAGRDAVSFLQGQVTCDLNSIPVGSGGFGAYCNLKGRVMTLFSLLHSDEALWLVLPEDISETVMATLKKYGMFSKVSISRATGMQALAIWGPQSTEALKHYYPVMPAQPGALLQQQHLYVYHMPWLPQTWLLLGNGEALDSATAAVQYTHTPATSAQWQYQRLRHKLIDITAERSEKFLPAELGIDTTEAVSFSKGCFLGQEIVARMKYLGTQKKQLTPIIINSSAVPAPKTKIKYQGKAAGEIVEGVLLENGQCYAVALLNPAQVGEAATLQLADGSPASLAPPEN